MAVGIEHVAELAERARQNVVQANRGQWLAASSGGGGGGGGGGGLVLECGDAIAWLEGRGGGPNGPRDRQCHRFRATVSGCPVSCESKRQPAPPLLFSFLS